MKVFESQDFKSVSINPETAAEAVEAKAMTLDRIVECYEKLGQFDNAERCFVNAIKNDKSQYYTHFKLAELLHQHKKYEEAYKEAHVLLQAKELPLIYKADLHRFITNIIETGNLTEKEGEAPKHYQLAIKLGQGKEKIFYIMNYDNYLGTKLYKQEKFKQALTHFKKMLIDSKQVEEKNVPKSQLCALYQMGSVYINDSYEGQDYSKALEYFKQCIEIFKMNKDLIIHHRELVGRAAKDAAILLEQGTEDIAKDPMQSLAYFELGAELNNPVCLHALGCQYEFGKNVSPDMKKAMHYYTKAAELNYAPAQTSLGLILMCNEKPEENEKAQKLLEKAAETNDPPALLGLTLYGLGCCHYLAYFRHQLAAKEGVTSAEQEQRAKNALMNFEKSAALGNRIAMLNAGVMLDLGLGVPQNLDKAEEYYSAAAKQGEQDEQDEPRAYENLVVLYETKLKHTKNEMEAREYARKISLCLKRLARIRTNTVPDSKIEDLEKSILTEETIQRIRNLQSETRKHCIAVNREIARIAADQLLAPVNRIQRILTIDLSAADAVNLATLIHRLGDLTEESLDAREFHNNKIPEALKILQKATDMLNEDKNEFGKQEITNIIEGMSKLYLQSSAVNFRDAIEKFYQAACKNIDKLELRELINIIYAASRLDPTHSIFKNQLPLLITAAFKKINSANKQDLSNFIYALALFDNGNFEYIKLGDFKNLISQIQKEFSLNIDNTAEARWGLHQCYLALSYFDKKYSSSSLESLTPWKECLLKHPSKTTSSKLQETVVSCLEGYTLDCVPEKNINTLPVDAFYQTSEKEGFLLQVDGPSHYLHDEKIEPILTLKTKFQTQFLVYSSRYPLVRIPYFEWQKQSLFNQDSFLLDMCKKQGVALDPQKWQTIPIRKQHIDPQMGFFHPPQTNEPPSMGETPKVDNEQQRPF